MNLQVLCQALDWKSLRAPVLEAGMLPSPKAPCANIVHKYIHIVLYICIYTYIHMYTHVYYIYTHLGLGFKAPCTDLVYT